MLTDKATTKTKVMLMNLSMKKQTMQSFNKKELRNRKQGKVCRRKAILDMNRKLVKLGDLIILRYQEMLQKIINE